MKSQGLRLAFVIFLALALCLTGGLVFDSVASAKKKRKKGGNIATVAKTVHARNSGHPTRTDRLLRKAGHDAPRRQEVQGQESLQP